MRVLGIDPGLLLTGYGCIDSTEFGGEERIVEAGVIRLRPGTPLQHRLRHLYDDLSELLDELTPEIVVVEKLFAAYRHPRTSILMAHARGVVLLAATQRGIELDELPATEVKKAITGHGHASKRQMQHAVMEQCRLATLPSPPDVADAIAIAVCAVRRRLLAG